MNQYEQPVAITCPQCSANLVHSGDDHIICQYCGSSLLWRRAEAEAAQTKTSVVRGIRLKEFAYTDVEGTGLEMFRLLAPAGWKMQGGCRWSLDNPAMPASLHVQFHNPQGLEKFEILPAINFAWFEDLMYRMMVPEGSQYFGAEVRPPVSIQQAFVHHILPRYRGMVSDLQIVKEEPLPDYPKLVRSNALVSGGEAEGGRIKIRYRSPQGSVFDEALYGLVERYRTASSGFFNTPQFTVWTIDHLFSFRAQADHLDRMENLFSVMIGSFKPNPHWYVAYQSLTQTLAQQQIQNIHHIGQISQIISQTSNEIHDQLMHSYQEREAVYDWLGTQWSRVNRGVDGYINPHTAQFTELPSGYGQAWANGLGEFILSDDPNFNPNIGATQNWDLMERDD